MDRGRAGFRSIHEKENKRPRVWDEDDENAGHPRDGCSDEAPDGHLIFDKGTLPRIYRIGEPNEFGDHRQKYKYISELL